MSVSPRDAASLIASWSQPYPPTTWTVVIARVHAAQHAQQRHSTAQHSTNKVSTKNHEIIAYCWLSSCICPGGCLHCCWCVPPLNCAITPAHSSSAGRKLHPDQRVLLLCVNDPYQITPRRTPACQAEPCQAKSAQCTRAAEWAGRARIECRSLHHPAMCSVPCTHLTLERERPFAELNGLVANGHDAMGTLCHQQYSF
jgi:hypothetical protein